MDWIILQVNKQAILMETKYMIPSIPYKGSNLSNQSYN